MREVNTWAQQLQGVSDRLYGFFGFGRAARVWGCLCCLCKMGRRRWALPGSSLK